MFIHNMKITYKILWDVWKFDIEEKVSAIRNQAYKDCSKTTYRDNKDKVSHQLLIML